MGHFYNAGLGQFMFFAPARVIRETQYGYDPNSLTFPNVSTCMAVTLLLQDQSLLGVHLAQGDPPNTVHILFNEMNQQRNGRAVQRVIIVGIVNAHSDIGWMALPQFHWPARLSTLNATFGRFPGGEVGTFVQTEGDRHYQVRAVGGGHVMVYSKPGNEPDDGGGWQAVELTEH